MNYKIKRVENYNAVDKETDDDIQHFKYLKKERVDGKWRYYYDYHNGDGWSDKIGFEVGKNDKGNTEISAFNTKKKVKESEYGPKKHGALTVWKAEDGVEYKVEIPTKKIKKYVNSGKSFISRLFGR